MPSRAPRPGPIWRSISWRASARSPRQHDDAAIAAAQTWIAEHYPRPNPVAEMTRRSELTPRTFKRGFRKHTGYRPLEYVQTLRMEEAKQLLEATALAVDVVAADVGYEDPAAFRQLFKRLVGIAPRRYRQRFRGIGRVTDAGAEDGRAPAR